MKFPSREAVFQWQKETLLLITFVGPKKEDKNGRMGSLELGIRSQLYNKEEGSGGTGLKETLSRKESRAQNFCRSYFAGGCARPPHLQLPLNVTQKLDHECQLVPSAKIMQISTDSRFPNNFLIKNSRSKMHPRGRKI
jgi:hypothetical protein